MPKIHRTPQIFLSMCKLIIFWADSKIGYPRTDNAAVLIISTRQWTLSFRDKNHRLTLYVIQQS
jgi:hypothetical protein